MNPAIELPARRLRRRASGRRPPSLFRLLACASVCALAASCGRGADADSGGSDRPASGDDPGGPAALALTPTGGPRDACDLIPTERIVAIGGAPVVTASDPGPRESSCSYTDETGQLSYVELTVYWTGGRQMLEVVQMGTALAAGMMAEHPDDQAMVDS